MKTALAFGLLSAHVLLNASAYAMQPMTDDDMAAYDGQSLVSLTTIAPGGTNPNTGIGFFRLGIQGKIELNANIKRLQLGCGGSKGVGCDIDLSNVRLTGVAADATNGLGPTTDAVLDNPFVEIAVKNPNIASQREITGLRVGALGALGRLSIGENPNPNNLGDDTGIASLSGDLTVYLTNTKLTNICVTVLGICTVGATGVVDPYTKSYQLNRESTLDLGPLVARTQSLVIPIPLLPDISLPLGLTLDNVNITDQPLRAVHQLIIAQDAAGTIPTKDFYLSLQKQNITWQTISTNSFSGAVTAQQGWWISLPQVQVSDLEITQRVDVPITSVVGGLFGANVTLDPIDLGQRPADNCYGALTFC